jgi:hypothetical protein
MKTSIFIPVQQKGYTAFHPRGNPVVFTVFGFVFIALLRE